MARRINIKPIKNLADYLDGLIKGRLWAKVIIALFLGILVGFVFGPQAGFFSPGTAKVVTGWIALPGKLFLVLIKMIVIPLVVASVILGIAKNEDMDMLKRLGPRIVVYFIFTTSIAVTIGFAAANLIKPGNLIDSESMMAQMEVEEISETEGGMGDAGLGDVPDRIISIIPENPLDAMVSKEMLQVVIFAIIFGVALASLKTGSKKIILDLLDSLLEVCMQVVRWAMWLAPLAVFGLLAEITSKIGFDILIGLGAYISTVFLGLFVHLIFYLVLVTSVSKISPFSFLEKIREVQLLAFSTSSSAAVMPLSMETAEEKLGVSPSISRFVVPLGATINMDGTALYQGVATVFLAQVYGVDLSVMSLVLVMVTAVGASIGTPGTPGVGIVILATVLSSVGIPPDGIALIIGVDRILDMSRTMINVTGDMTACVVMDRLLGVREASGKSA